MKKIFPIIIILILLASFNLNSKNIGSPFQIIDNITTDKYDQQNPSIISLQDKELWFVAWEDWKDSLNGPDIYGGVIKPTYDNDGNLSGAEVCYVTEITESSDDNSSTNPSVAYDPYNKKIIVAWQSGFEIKFRSIDVTNLSSDDCDNLTLNSVTTIGDPGFGYKTSGDIIPLPGSRTGRARPKIIYNKYDKKFWIAWLEGRSKRNKISIDVKTCSSHLAFNQDIGGNIFLVFTNIDPNNSFNIDFLKYPTTTREDNAIFVSSEKRTDNSTARRLQSVGTPTGTVTLKYEYFTNLSDFAIKENQNGGIYLAWEGINNEFDFDTTCNDDGTISYTYSSTPKTTKVQIYGSLTDNLLSEGVESTRISTDNNNNNYHPSIAFDPVRKRYLIAWENVNNGVSKIYGQMVDAVTGTKYLDNIKLISSNEEELWGDYAAKIHQTDPSATFDPINQRFTVAWQDGRNGLLSSENLDIYAQNIDTEGSLRGYNFLITTAEGDISAKGNQYAPKLSYNKYLHSFLSVWKDARNLNTSRSDIYGQLFTPGQPQIFISKKEDSSTSPLLPLYYDFKGLNIGSEKTFDIILKNTGDYNLKIYDIYLTDNSSSYYELNYLDPNLIDKDKNSYIEISPGAELTFNVSFSPKEIGSYLGTIEIDTDAGSKIISLQGLGIGASANVTESLDFGEVTQGMDNITKYITIENSGQTNITIKNIEILDNGTCSSSGYTYNKDKFYIDSTNLAGTIISPEEKEQISTVFLSSDDNSTGKYCAQVKVDLSFSDRSFYVELYGSIKKREAKIVIYPQTFNITTNVSEEKSENGMISNFFDNSTEIKEISLNDTTHFSIEGISSGDDINSNASKSFSVKFLSSDIGSYSIKGIIKLKVPIAKDNCSGEYKWDNDSSECIYSSELQISGTAKGILTTSPSSIKFSDTTKGVTTSTWVSIINNSGSDVSISSIFGPTYPFSIGNEIKEGDIIPAGAKFPFQVSFTPPYEDSFSSSIIIQLSNGQTINIPLSGNGLSLTTTTNIEIDPSSLDFGTIYPSGEKSLTFEIKNNSSDFIAIDNISELGEPFKLETDIAKNTIISPNGSIYVKISFYSETYISGSFSTSLSIKFSNGQSYILPLKGKISSDSDLTETSVTVSENPVNFGDIEYNQESVKTIFITNSETYPIKITNIIKPSAPFFKIENIDQVQETVLYPNQQIPIIIKAESYYYIQGIVNSYIMLFYDNGGFTQIDLKFNPIIMLINPSEIDFGKVYSTGDETYNSNIFIKNLSSYHTYYLTSAKIDGDDECFNLNDYVQNEEIKDNITLTVSVNKKVDKKYCNAKLILNFTSGDIKEIPLKAEIISQDEVEQAKLEELGIKSTFPDTGQTIETMEGLANLYFVKISNNEVTSPRVFVTGDFISYESLKQQSSNFYNSSWINNIFKSTSSSSSTSPDSYIYAFYMPQNIKNNLTTSDFKYYPASISIISDSKRIFNESFNFKVYSANTIWKDYIPTLKILINGKHSFYSSSSNNLTLNMNISAKLTPPESSQSALYLIIIDKDFKNIWWVSENGKTYSLKNIYITPIKELTNNYVEYNKQINVQWPDDANKGLYYVYWLLWDSNSETFFFDVAGVVINDL